MIDFFHFFTVYLYGTVQAYRIVNQVAIHPTKKYVFKNVFS